MRADDGLRDAQTDAVPAGFAAARGIRAVKAVEEFIQTLARDRRRRGVPDRERGEFSLPRELQADDAVLRRVFHGVVEQDAHKLADRLFIAAEREVLLDLAGEGLALLHGAAVEGLRRLVHDVGQREIDEGRSVRALLHAGEIDQIVREIGEPARLQADVREPLALPVQLHFEHIRVRLDDGEGRFDLVPGVGDEALLLFVALRHGAHHAAGEGENEQEHREQAERGDGKAREEERPERVEIAAAVEEEQQRAVLRVRFAPAVIVDEAALLAALERILRVFDGVRHVDGGDLPGVDAQDVAGFVHGDGEESALIGHLLPPDGISVTDRGFLRIVVIRVVLLVRVQLPEDVGEIILVRRGLPDDLGRLPREGLAVGRRIGLQNARLRIDRAGGGLRFRLGRRLRLDLPLRPDARLPRLHREDRGNVIFFVSEALRLREGAAVGGENVQNLVRVLHDVAVGKVIRRAENHAEDEQQGRHGQRNEAHAKPLKHPP